MPDRRPYAALSALAEACAAFPDMRVMQVVVNALGNDPFYVENEDAVRLLREYAQSSPLAYRPDREEH